MFKPGLGKRQAAPVEAVLSYGTTFTGTLHCHAPVRIEGVVHGSIASTDLIIISESAIVTADVTARDIVIAGKLIGEIHAEQRLTLASTAEIHGNVIANSLIVFEGAILDGTTRMERPVNTTAEETNASETEDSSVHSRAEAG
ncbi:Polymer-forming cytoskeletal [compost metagenome]